MSVSDYDSEKLKSAIESELLGAYFGGGYGAALVETPDLDRMTEKELIETAKMLGIDVSKYKQN
ncbi:hypothetical protein [Butyrivibrio sp. LC3010]|uniref:hypothetical protein n=1 Tax=Butyrivibrio sp. LC3010 TaxID=1280680 RepID=UPI0003FFDEB4|nr:hypothetical protein [Butyrivibrio sp. LC3010]